MNLNPLKLDSEVEMDQSDLQLYSLDKDLVDSRHKANQNLLKNKFVSIHLNSNSGASLEMDQLDLQLYSLDKDLVDSRHKANQNLVENENLNSYQYHLNHIPGASLEWIWINKISNCIVWIRIWRIPNVKPIRNYLKIDIQIFSFI